MAATIQIARGANLHVGSGIPPSPARRLLDIVVAVVALAFLVPLFALLVPVVRRSTGGSAIFRQSRVGQGGVPFTLLKLRSMRVSLSGPEVTTPGDRRVTRVGALLRCSSVDELPQLINVLRGQMTLVGPRPETLALAERYPDELQFIFRYRPGLTGPAQVMVRDEEVLGGVAEPESFYLERLVPHRVSIDLLYLEDAGLGSTVAWMARTLRYLADTVRRRLAGELVAPQEARP